jgi:DNA helicase INO80
MTVRLEFLIRQSDIYANFIARKLGILEEEKKEPMSDAKEEEKVEIDESLAKKKVQDMINTHLESLRAFDQETQALRMERGGPAGVVSQVHDIQEEDLENPHNRFDNPDAAYSNLDGPPRMFVGDLKEYQLKGLKWLDNLHEQAINGILADEMGLGKTIQAIAFLAHLAENKGNWGPFLIIAPSSTLYNWQQEFNKFCPSLHILPYWGALADRKTLRKFFNSKQLYTPSSPFHVLVTSYQLVVADEKCFHKIIWQYMILDEAQAIKNIQSQRWKTLLGFNCRNRLLMTGTPIQNSMAELWALLHFIMPKLFDNHEQFQEWFSKDIEAHSTSEKELNSTQLSRLHAVLKPFMLRRVKKDVEHEIGPKEEVEIECEMTSRQQILYKGIKDHLSNITDLFSLVDSKQKIENLMNIVMQLRKVCNHPELFERRIGRTPALFVPISPSKPLYT